METTEPARIGRATVHFFPIPSKRTTRMEWAIIFWLFVVVLLASGGLYLYYGYTAPVKTQETADWVYYGKLYLGTAALVLATRWAVRRWFDV